VLSGAGSTPFYFSEMFTIEYPALMPKTATEITKLFIRLMVWSVAINCLTCFAFVGSAYSAGKSPRAEMPGTEGYTRALDLIKQGKNSEALPLLETAWRDNPRNSHILADYLATLVWLRQYDKAIKIYAAHRNTVKGVPYLYRNMAKAYFERENYRQAQPLYLQAFSFDHSDAEALKGVIFASWKLRRYLTGFKAWLTAYQQQSVAPQTLEAMKIYMMRHLGASTLAWLYARQVGVKDKQLMASLQGDVAQERIKWEEYDVAIQILEQELRENPGNFRARCDYILALRDQKKMQEVLDQYQMIEKSGQPSPYWVTEAVADALLYSKRPKEAVKFYRRRLDQSSEAPFNPTMGLASTYTELRDWDNAEQSYGQVQALLKQQRLNADEAYDALVARGWFLIYQDKLQEAQEVFNTYVGRAGLGPGFRSGLGSAYYFRGWPRRALEQFRIVHYMDAKYVPAQLGLAASLNEIGYKYEARRLAAELYQKYPRDLHVIDLYENLRVEDLNTFWGDARFTREWPGVVEYRFRTGAIATITPLFNVFSNIMHMHSRENSSGQRYAYSWDRLGGGFNWRLLPSLTLTEAVSADYLKGRDLGSFTKVNWQANDHLRAAASFDSFSLELPLRARATGVKGKTANLDLSYHESDLREYGLGLTSNWMSDGNYNPSVILFMDQKVINNPNWKLRLGPEFYYGRYSKNANDVPYFSPNFEYSLSLKPTLQIIWHDMYDKKIRTNVYTHIGIYKEWGYGIYPTTGITLEQEIKLSKTFAMRATVGYNLRVYDGEYTNVLDGFFTLVKRF
jgi:biofilm PGA synthesis protein PgaA